ncbi:MAG: PaaI family thioesterase [Pseudomonadota bacterium]
MKFDPSLPWRDISSGGFNQLIGPARFARAGENEWHGMLALDERHRNVGGVCHGGVTLSLADLTMGTATFEAGGRRPCATIEMGSHFLAAAKMGQSLLAIATQDRGVRDLSFMSCEIWATGDDSRRLVMRASGIWKYLASREAQDPQTDPPKGP